MRRRLHLLVLTSTLIGISSSNLLPIAEQEIDNLDPATYARIRDEGSNRSQVMNYATELMDGIGPRLTGSRNLDRAIAWSVDRLAAVGASNIRKETWGEFGMGWQQRNVWVRLVEPYAANFVVTAAPWSPATRGPIGADVVAVHGFNDERGFAPLRGTLRGKIVLFGRAPSAPAVFPIDKPLLERLDNEQLAAFASRAPATVEAERVAFERAYKTGEFAEKISRFFADEGVRAVIVPSGNNARGGASGGTIYADLNYDLGMRAFEKAHMMRVPLVIVATEEYLRLSRLLERKVAVRVELNVDVEFSGDHASGVNVLADLPGSDNDRKNEIVMATAHLDSWAAATGATDDGAGVVIAVEAIRILHALGLRPARTITVALWTGEEQGLLGSTAYVRRHLADAPRATTDEQLRMPESIRQRVGPLALKPEHARVSAIYNIDTGAGRIRGIALSQNTALVPIFEQWIAPLRDLGVTLVTDRPWCPGDCRPFYDVGIPTPSFIQDPLEYATRTHHTNSDTYDRLIPEDLRQAAIVMATMLYNTAMRSKPLPRLPLPH